MKVDNGDAGLVVRKEGARRQSDLVLEIQKVTTSQVSMLTLS
jgi:hypothetical protein